MGAVQVLRGAVLGAQKLGLYACWFLYSMAQPLSLWEILAWVLSQNRVFKEITR